MNLQRIIFVFFLCSVFFNALFATGNIDKADNIDVDKPKEVLLLLSYNIATPWTTEVVKSVEQNLRSDKVKIDVMSMNSYNRIAELPPIEDCNLILERIKKKKYDAIIAVDPAAFKLISQFHNQIKESTPIISIGCALIDDNFIKDHPNFIPIRQDFKIEDNFNLALKLFPDTKEIVVLLNSSYEGKILNQEYRKISDNLASLRNLKLTYLDSRRLSTDDMLEYLGSLPQNSVIMYVSWATLSTYDHVGIFEKIRDACQLPIISPMLKNNNILCGYMSEPSAHAKIACDMVKSVLFGNKSVYSLKGGVGPVVDYLNWPEAKKFGKTLADMPEGFEYVNTPKTNFMLLVETILLFLTIGAFAITILFLAYKRRIFRKKLENIYKNLPISLAISDKYGNTEFMYSENTNENTKNFDELKSSEGKLYTDTIKSLVESGKSLLEFEYSIDGLRKIATVRRVPEKIFGKDKFVCTATDITENFKAQEKLKQYVNQERILNNSLKLVSQDKDPNEVLKGLLKNVKKQMGADRIFIYMFNADKSSMKRFTQWEIEEEHLPALDTLSISDYKDIIDNIENRQVVYLRDSNTKNQFMLMKKVSQAGIRQVFLAGIWSNNELIGCIGVSYLNLDREFSEVDEQMLKATASVVEISKGKLAYKQNIKKAEFEKETIINSMDIPVIIFDLDMNILAENTAANGMAQCIPGRMLKTDCPCVLKLEVCLQDRCLFRNCIRHKREFSGDINIKNVPYKATVKPLFDIRGNMYRLLCTLVDMTDFAQRQEKIEAAMRAEKNANRAKSVFLATMSHEIRTPLNAIIGYSELTQDINISESERIENLKDIHFAADSLLALINDILDLSKLEAGQIEIFRTATNIETMLRNLSRIFALRIERKKLTLEYDFQKDIPLLMLDNKRLKQVVMNLLGNAVKFTSQGYIKISVRYQKCNLTIAIKDTGIGVADAYKKRIFEPFEQQPEITPQQRREGGTGLGLPIAEKLTEAMNGKIELESKVGEGSTFTVVLSNVDMATSKNDSQIFLQEIGNMARSDIKKHVAIIVDDVPMNLKILASILKRLGVNYHACNSGKEALRLLEYCDATIVLTDFWMPDMNGDILADKFHQISGMSNLPVIAVTADIQAGKHSEIFNDILFKPLTIANVRDMLMKYPTEVNQ